MAASISFTPKQTYFNPNQIAYSERGLAAKYFTMVWFGETALITGFRNSIDRAYEVFTKGNDEVKSESIRAQKHYWDQAVTHGDSYVCDEWKSVRKRFIEIKQIN